MSEPTSVESLPDCLQNLSDDELEREIARLSREVASPPTTEKTGRVCTTAYEAAAALGVSLATFQSWIGLPGFPGKPGGNNQRNAYWPVDEIKAWHAARYGETSRGGSGDELRKRKLAAEVAQREAKLRQQLGQVVDLDLAHGLWSQSIASARSKLEEIPERIADAIPTSRPKLRRRCAAIAERVVRDVLLELAALTLSTIDRDELGEDAEHDSDGDESRRQNRTRSKESGPPKAAKRRRRRVGGRKATKPRKVGGASGEAGPEP